MYRSKIEHAELLANEDYYLVIDGYGHEHGEYTLAIDFHDLCDLACPTNGVPEGEPTLHDGYVDGWNGGCDTSDSDPPFQAIVGDPAGAAVLCGVAGWYLDPWYYRDTDWYTVAMGPAGTLDITIDAEVETHVGELLPHDCAAVAVTSYATAYCEPATLTVSGHAPGEIVWIWVSSARFTPPGWGFEEYEYLLWISGLETGVAVEAASWSTIKALYE